MKKGMCLGLLFFVIIVSGALPGSKAIAETSTAMTALEKKLYEAARKEGALEFWDSIGIKEMQQLWKGFESKYPGIKLNYFEAENDVCAEKYLMEHSANRHTVDIMPVQLYDMFKEKSLLTSISDVINDSGYPKKFASKDLDAVSLEHSLNGASYNSKLVSPKDVPRSWDDLLNPKWKGKIGVENRLNYFVFGTGYWGEEKVVDYLKKMSKQGPIFTKGITQTLTLLNAGEFAFAVGTTFHGTLRLQAGGGPVEYAPISPIVDKMTPHVVMRHAPHPNAAKLLLHWWMSPEGAAYVDAIRHKGNPLPGSGTQTSKLLEKKGNLEIHLANPWSLVGDQSAIEKKYQSAIGFHK